MADTAAGPHVRGEEHGQVKLTETEVLEIRLLSKLGIFHPDDLEPYYPVTGYTIRKLAKGSRWKHLERNPKAVRWVKHTAP